MPCRKCLPWGLITLHTDHLQEHHSLFNETQREERVLLGSKSHVVSIWPHKLAAWYNHHLH